jgi:hypothetical protein
MSTKHYGKYRDTKADTWVAIDRQGRVVSTAEKEGIFSPNEKVVGIFYWTWHGNLIENEKYNNGPYDVSKILESYPDALDNPDNPSWGRLGGGTHYWGEPMFGYYLNDDEYVIRKHTQMLCDAGVDFIAFDASNFNSIKNISGEHPGYFRISTKFLLDTYLKIRKEGKPTPQVTFICPFFTSDFTSVKTAYEDFYRDGEYDSLWYRISNKPLMLFNKEHVKDQELLNYFSFRRDMPDYHIGPTGKDQWPWLENYPQHAFFSSNDDDKPEMISVGVAQNSVINPHGGWRLGALSERDESGRFIARGRSFHNGEQPQKGEDLYLPEKGFNFLEQWSRAFELDTKGVFITGWNEWIMGRWAEFSHYKFPGIFVDQFNQEFSRDIEPMRGGHLDDYYYQLVDNIRKFKGVRKQEKADGLHTIDVEDFSSWENVKNEYLDDIGDTYERFHRGFGEAGMYYVPKGRNDFELSKVAHDDDFIYFYVKTVELIKPYLCGMGAWMQLLISVHDDVEMPSWEGYHFTVNRLLKDKTRSILEFSSGGWNWNKVCEVDICVQNNEMALRIPRKALHLHNRPVAFDFKWIDSMNPQKDILELYTHGDTAPNARFAYRYSE